METSFISVRSDDGSTVLTIMSLSNECGVRIKEPSFICPFTPHSAIRIPQLNYAALSEKASLPNRSSSPGLIACGTFGWTFLRLT